MSSLAIKVDNVSKMYRLGQVGTGSIKHDFNRFWHRVRGKEDPYLKIGQKNDRTAKAGSEYVWALKDIGFEVRQGEVLGIIGKNGAGKSTLLKILSKITAPTTGRIDYNGRIASLLEVGTGFHPEMTGRENIFMNGAILGMRKWEIQKKFEEIVEFAGVSAYIDTPVKRYSSGMIVRLGFAVAAHLEPEIMIIDEVLAVGDAEFQKKCLGRMKDISSNDGRTVLFVSHNMAAVRSLCHRGLVLEKGGIKMIGEVEKAVAAYMNDEKGLANHRSFKDDFKTAHVQIEEIFLSSTEHPVDRILDEFSTIELHTKLQVWDDHHGLHLTYVLTNEYGEPLFTFSHVKSNVQLHKGENHLVCRLPKGFLNTGTYYLTLYMIKDKRETVFVERDIMVFNIQEGQRNIGSWMGKEPGFIKPEFDWHLK